MTDARDMSSTNPRRVYVTNSSSGNKDDIITLLTSINYGLMELNSRVRTIENMLGLETDLRYNKETADKLDRISKGFKDCNEKKVD